MCEKVILKEILESKRSIVKGKIPPLYNEMMYFVVNLEKLAKSPKEELLLLKIMETGDSLSTKLDDYIAFLEQSIGDA